MRVRLGTEIEARRSRPGRGGPPVRARYSAEAYNERVESAIASLRLQHPNFFLFGRGRTTDERSVVHVENGRYRGFGYADEGTGQQLDDLRSVITLRDDNRDIQRILRQQLMNTLPRNLLIYQDELRYE